MCILFVTPYYFPELKFGGPPRKMHALSCGLLQRGHQVQVVTFHSEKPRARHCERMDGVRVQYLPWVGRGLRQWPLSFNPLAAAIREADLVHGYGLYDLIGPAAAFLARRQRRPYVLEPLGMYVPRARNVRVKKIYNAIFTCRMAAAAAGVVAASLAEKSDLLPLVEACRLKVRRNGINLDEFAQLPAGETFRAHWRIGPADKIILYLGRLSPIKNLEQLVGAFHRAQLPATRLVLAGPVEETGYVAQLKGRIAALKLQDQVTLTGSLFGMEKLAALAAADLFVLPSLSESFGNAAAEAVAARVPVLLTDTCGIAGMIHGRAGLAVPLGEESLAQGLRTMMKYPESRAAAMSRLDEVRAELSWEAPILQTEAMYRDIIAQSREK